MAQLPGATSSGTQAGLHAEHAHVANRGLFLVACEGSHAGACGCRWRVEVVMSEPSDVDKIVALAAVLKFDVTFRHGGTVNFEGRCDAFTVNEAIGALKAEAGVSG